MNDTYEYEGKIKYQEGYDIKFSKRVQFYAVWIIGESFSMLNTYG